MLITPYSHEEEFKYIPGIKNCIGIDMIPDAIIENSSNTRWQSEDWKPLSRELERLINAEKIGSQMLFFELKKMNPYQAITPFVKIPGDCYGSIGPRSTLSKLNCLVNESSDIDPGYEGRLSVLLLPLSDLEIRYDIPLFSVKLYRVEDQVKKYNGAYLNRRS